MNTSTFMPATFGADALRRGCGRAWAPADVAAEPRTATPTADLRSSPRVMSRPALRGSELVMVIPSEWGPALARHRSGDALEDADGVAGERCRVDVLGVGADDHGARAEQRPSRQAARG